MVKDTIDVKFTVRMTTWYYIAKFFSFLGMDFIEAVLGEKVIFQTGIKVDDEKTEHYSYTINQVLNEKI